MAINSTVYLQNVIKKYSVDSMLANKYLLYFLPYLKIWAGEYLVDVKISGSSRKGTAVSNGTDLDLFISLSSITPFTLTEIFDSLSDYMIRNSFQIRRQNVSIGVIHNSYNIDLVPAKRQSQYGNDHSLCVTKKDTWIKTNIEIHILHILRSSRITEIKLTKIWRNINQLNFPSFYLELLVVDALYNCRIGEIELNFMKVLLFIADNIENRTYIDPANTNNLISDQLSKSEKRKIALIARNSSTQTYWENIIS